ncbi:hypothetical protein ABE425_04705 [Chryseobacterium cucumeris]|uniref:hypothetical protein n=1 Tax=Chryseobacterium cucumeris TaxID=1813611 RepID=UPI00320A838E
MDFQEFIVHEEDKARAKDIREITCELTILRSSLSKLDQKYPTNFSDEVARHFPKGRVGFMNGRGAKKMHKDLETTIKRANEEQEIEKSMSSLSRKLELLKKGKLKRDNGLVVESYKFLCEMRTAYEMVIKTGIVKDRVLDKSEIDFAKNELKKYKKLIGDREKLFVEKFNTYLKSYK